MRQNKRVYEKRSNNSPTIQNNAKRRDPILPLIIIILIYHQRLINVHSFRAHPPSPAPIL